MVDSSGSGGGTGLWPFVVLGVAFVGSSGDGYDGEMGSSRMGNGGDGPK